MATVTGTSRSETLNEKDGVTNGSDEIYGFDGADHLYGRGGNDLLKGGGGGDYLDGGDGFDLADYRESNAAVLIYLGAGPDDEGHGYGGSAEGDTLVRIEDIFGSDYSDGLFGNSEGNNILGFGGSDSLSGYDNNDYLDGGAGDDSLTGGAGADFLIGGPGLDTAVYYEAPTGVWVSLMPHPVHGLGYGTGGEAEGDTLYQIEALAGSQYGDTLIGDDGFNQLSGNGGADRLFGHGGYDLLIGGPGRDELSGGGDHDDFIWFYVTDTATTVAQMDVITDFNAAEGDRIKLDAIDANVYATGDQAFTFIGMAAFSGAPGEINYRYEGGNTIIQMQTGVVIDIEGGIVLQGIHTPTAAWFVL